jgi:hypothetical protein
MLFHAIPLHPGNVTMAPFREALHAVHHSGGAKLGISGIISCLYKYLKQLLLQQGSEGSSDFTRSSAVALLLSADMVLA